MFCRDFMEYHQDRFNDFSLMVFKANKLVALLPANRTNNTLFSHQGLSYGGLILGLDETFVLALNAFNAILKFLEKNGFKSLHLKLTPRMYFKEPSDEINYLLFKLDAELYRRDVSSVIGLKQQPNIMASSNRKRGIKRAIKHELRVEEVGKFSEFWSQILEPNLREHYNVTPVHTLKEIEYLKRCFPNNIRQFNVYFGSDIVAGATIFESDLVAHVQYIASNNKRQELGSLDLLFHTLITETFAHKTFFDFGISNESEGAYINKGLLQWKSSFGAKTIVHEFYNIDIEKHKLLDSVFI